MQQQITDFATNAQDSSNSATWTPDFADFGPTMDRPLPDAELAAMFESGGTAVDRREIPDSGLTLSDITDWPYSHINRIKAAEREHFEETMEKINPAQDDIQQNSRSENRLLAILETIEERETGSYVPGQGTALDTVNAIRRTADLRPVAEWSIPEIEATLYNLGHLFESLEIRSDNPGQNCKQLSRRAEALHQDLIDELQEREHFDADTRQYLTNQFGSACSLVEYANTPGYCAGNHFEEIQRISDISDRITALFDDGDGVTRCDSCGEKMPAGMFDECSSCSKPDETDQPDAGVGGEPEIATDGGIAAADFDNLDELGRGSVLTLDKLEGEYLLVDRKEVPLGTVQSLDVVDEDGQELRLQVVALDGERYFDVLDGHETPVVKNTANIDDVRDFEVIRHDQQWLEEYLAETIPHFSP